MSPKLTKHQYLRVNEIGRRRIAGQKTKEIAKEIGLTPDTVRRYLKRDDVKEWIEREQLGVLEALPNAVQNITGLVNGMKGEKDKDERRLCFEATKEVLKVGGIIPTNTQSTFIQNIYGQNNLVLSPVLKEMLERHEKSLEWKEDVVDVEPKQ